MKKLEGQGGRRGYVMLEVVMIYSERPMGEAEKGREGKIMRMEDKRKDGKGGDGRMRSRKENNEDEKGRKGKLMRMKEERKDGN